MRVSKHDIDCGILMIVGFVIAIQAERLSRFLARHQELKSGTTPKIIRVLSLVAALGAAVSMLIYKS